MYCCTRRIEKPFGRQFDPKTNPPQGASSHRISVVRCSAKTSIRFNLVNRMYVRKQYDTSVLRRFFGGNLEGESSLRYRGKANHLAVLAGYLSKIENFSGSWTQSTPDRPLTKVWCGTIGLGCEDRITLRPKSLWCKSQLSRPQSERCLLGEARSTPLNEA